MEKSLFQRTNDTAVSGVQGAASQSDILITVDCPQSILVSADIDRIVQVLTNFLSNAIKFSPAGSTVHVSVVESDWDMVRFSVKDNGPGISQEQIDRLFVRFQQLDSSDTRQQGGTGLGLAISKELISLHGGKVGLESTVGKGSCFWFEIRTHDIGVRLDELSQHEHLLVNFGVVKPG